MEGTGTGALFDAAKGRVRKDPEKRVEEAWAFPGGEGVQDERERGPRGAIRAILLIGEMRDPYTARHQRRVAKHATALAGEMKLSVEAVDEIHLTGLLHDVGKLVLPAEILSKPGRISDYELNLIKTHSHAGYNILREAEFPWPVVQTVLQHHERWNGTGYPSGISAEGILLSARILAVADVVDAMTSQRPYRPAMGVEQVVDDIARNRGILYDPDVVDALLKLVGEKALNLGA